MQCAVVEFARHVANIPGANSEEMERDAQDNVIYLMKEWFDYRTQSIVRRDSDSDKGGTMRLGSYPCVLEPGTLAAQAYAARETDERHRHRYEFNNAYRQKLEEAGLVFSGTSPDGSLVEIMELRDHPWFLGCQFHPEFKSRPLQAHPLFRDFIKAAKSRASQGSQAAALQC